MTYLQMRAIGDIAILEAIKILMHKCIQHAVISSQNEHVVLIHKKRYKLYLDNYRSISFSPHPYKPQSNKKFFAKDVA